MDAASPAKRLKNELSCSLCRGYFTEPVDIECGHSFCQGCIICFWSQQGTGFCCPQCGEKSESRELKSNKKLGAVATTVKQMKFEASEMMCEAHQKPLELFCKEEGKLLCPGCAGSEEHAARLLVPAEEAAEDYKLKLQIHLRVLMEERQKALDFQTKEEKRNKEFLGKVDGEKQKIVSKIEELQRFLEEQKKAMLDQLDELVKKQEQFATRISSEIYVFDTLICEVEEKCKQPSSVFLQDVGETSSRFRIWEFQQPLDVPSELEEKLCAISKNYLIVQKTVKEFKETFSADAEALNLVKVTLSPDTAGSSLQVSADQKTLRLKRGNRMSSFSDLTQDHCVLGCEKFTSGRHYWEVKVGEKLHWAVGVARQSVKRQEELQLKAEDGVWVIKKEYNLRAVDRTLNSVIPKTVGIFLDYKLNRVVFFDADRGIALHTFYSDSLVHEKVRPFFWLRALWPREFFADEAVEEYCIQLRS